MFLQQCTCSKAGLRAILFLFWNEILLLWSSMMQFFLVSGGLLAFFGVLARSLSAHALLERLSASAKLDNFNLAADYLVVHGLPLITVALLCRLFPHQAFLLSGWAFVLGSFLFQGTVLIKCFTSMGLLGVATPVGGLVLMLGWVCIVWGGLASVSAP